MNWWQSSSEIKKEVTVVYQTRKLKLRFWRHLLQSPPAPYELCNNREIVRKALQLKKFHSYKIAKGIITSSGDSKDFHLHFFGKWDMPCFYTSGKLLWWQSYWVVISPFSLMTITSTSTFPLDSDVFTLQWGLPCLNAIVYHL